MFPLHPHQTPKSITVIKTIFCTLRPPRSAPQGPILTLEPASLDRAAPKPTGDGLVPPSNAPSKNNVIEGRPSSVGAPSHAATNYKDANPRQSQDLVVFISSAPGHGADPASSPPTRQAGNFSGGKSRDSTSASVNCCRWKYDGHSSSWLWGNLENSEY